MKTRIEKENRRGWWFYQGGTYRRPLAKDPKGKKAIRAAKRAKVKAWKEAARAAQVQAEDLTFGPQRKGAQYAVRPD